MLANQFLVVRQKALLASLTSLNQKLQSFQSQEKVPRSLDHVWAAFIVLNRSLNKCCTDVHRTATYWSLPLSVYFLLFITLNCYLTYIVFFVKHAHLAAHALFVYGLVEVEAGLYFVVALCARLSKMNRKVEKGCGNFYRTFLWQKGFAVGGSTLSAVNVSKALKVLLKLL